MNKKHVVRDAINSGKDPSDAMLEGVRYYNDLISSGIYPIDSLDITAALVVMEAISSMIRSNHKEAGAMANIAKVMIGYDYKSMSGTASEMEKKYEEFYGGEKNG